MNSLYICFVVHLIVVAASFAAKSQNEQDQKTLIMLEFEAVGPEDRIKRSSANEGLRYIRQSAAVPPEYLGLLQQLAAQRDQAAAGQPQQHLIQQLVVSREGSKQPAAARYVLSQDGRLLQESVGLSALGQPQQLLTSQGPLALQQPQAPQGSPIQPGRPLISPELAEFSRQQQRLQQEYHDAPIRAQIASTFNRPQPRPQAPPPQGAGPQGPQIFLQPQGVPARFRNQLQAQDPNLVYAPVPYDAQALLQQQLAAQLAAGAVPDQRELFSQVARPNQGPPAGLLFQQASQPEVPQQTFTARPATGVSPSSQPQLLPQHLPQQYLIETSRTTPQPQQYVQADAPQIQQIQYVQQPTLVPQPAQPQPPQPRPQQQQQSDLSTLLQPAPGRGLFTPVKPSRSSIYVTRASTPKPLGLNIEEVVSEPAEQKLPVVRIPSPTNQRPLTRNELQALINAGFTVTPVQNEEPQASNFLKSKRQQPLLNERKNHVVYQNHQDGVQYQYSPGSSSPFTPSIRSKKAYTVGQTDKKADVKSLYKPDTDRSDDKQLVTYVLTLNNESS